MKFSQLKFLTDENISPKIISFLRENSYVKMVLQFLM
jgi:hypothetical protein